MTRAEIATEVCRRVAKAVEEAVPAGLGRWGPAWDLVADPSDAFLDALADYQAAGSGEAEERVQRTANELVAAWREAGRQYREVGSPGAVEVPA